MTERAMRMRNEAEKLSQLDERLKAKIQNEVEANLKKIIEERWNVSKTKQLVVMTQQFLRDRSALFDKDASELRYRSEIVNLLLAGAFEMTERSIWLKTGEIENEIQKCKGMILRRILMSGQNLE
ncbi:hypothetical protein RhiirA1_474511 [Rhizophagus irregularis]|uniref:Uncharacterized protein n=1 Tax=Rhizophagus irregularis TaxID=588596 RepID=A0A2N0QYN2_9GLOM|nr:hypothetical protein RhiirA1_474511 [Rhizophagus irregularis]